MQDLANIVCDFYVNAGVNATKLLQSVMNDIGANLMVDGGIGSSLKALASLDHTDVYRRATGKAALLIIETSSKRTQNLASS